MTSPSHFTPKLRLCAHIDCASPPYGPRSSLATPPSKRSRTSGSAIVRDTITRFFAVLPNPTAVLDAPDDVIIDVINPLGLQPTRLRAVRSISEGFLGTDWEDPTEFYGCGKFVADSWRIFCRGDVSGAGEGSALRQGTFWHGQEGGPDVSRAL
jgi:hypothetical protein